MIKVYISGHGCREGAVVPDRYWIVNLDKKAFKHLGTSEMDTGFLTMILKETGIELVHMYIPDEAFKNFLISLGYTQI